APAGGIRRAPAAQALRAPRTRTGAGPRPATRGRAMRMRRGNSNEAPRRAGENGLPRVLLLGRALLSSLAAGAPVGDAVVVALAAARDRRTAARAGAAGAPVDDPLDPVAFDGRAHELRRAAERREQLRVRHPAEADPRRETGSPERLGAPDVPDPGHE